MYALDEGTKQITYTVMCMSCSTAIFHPRMSVFEWDAYDTEEEAVAAWNTRHVETCEFNIVEEYIPGKRQRSNICECSNCGYRCAYGFIVDERFKFCPNCGRKVEG